MVKQCNVICFSKRSSWSSDWCFWGEMYFFPEISRQNYRRLLNSRGKVHLFAPFPFSKPVPPSKIKPKKIAGQRVLLEKIFRRLQMITMFAQKFYSSANCLIDSRRKILATNYLRFQNFFPNFERWSLSIVASLPQTTLHLCCVILFSPRILWH